ncbi:MAG: hypothetical protein WBA74_14720 [Cyclobacteriaceae bacterium]
MQLKKICLIIWFCFIGLMSYGQTDISFQSGLQLPLGGLSNIYKPALGYELSYFSEFKKTAFSAGVGYVNFQPKESIFYFKIEPQGSDNFTEVGTAKFSNYRMIPLSVEIHKYFKQRKRAKLYP